MENTFLKYRLYYPTQVIRFLYYNLIKIKRVHSSAFFIPSRHSILDIDKTASIEINQSLLFGWCNMKYSRLETSLYMGKRAMLKITGGGKKMLIGYGTYIQIENNAKLTIGNSFINREVKIICNKEINIGNDCIIAMGTVIRDNDGGKHQILNENYINAKPITIGNHVWIGENVMILKGVTIGNGAIIAAGSLVTKDIPPHSLAMGRPAKIVRENIEWKA